MIAWPSVATRGGRFVWCAFSILVPASAGATTDGRVMLEKYCISCHGGNEEIKGEVDLRPLLASQDFTPFLGKWHDVLDQVDFKNMPPARPADLPRPTDEEYDALVAWIEAGMASTSGNEQRYTRRLNRAQYNNTIRDLLGVNVNPAGTFPQDLGEEGFDTVARVQSISPLLWNKYAEAAQKVLAMAIVSGDAPAKFHFRYYPATRDQRSGASPFKASPVGLETLVGKPGHPVTETGARFMGMDFGSGSTSEKWMAVREGKGPHGYEVVLEHSGRSSARGELEFTNPLPLGKYRLKFKVYAEALDREGKGFEPVDTCIAGLYVNEVRVADFSIPVGSEPVEYVQEIQTGIERTKIKISAGTQVGRIEAGRVPRLVLTEAEIEGPLMDSWPLPSHQTVLGDDPKAKPEVWLQPFLTRAFRRPASSQEVSRYAEIYYAERKEDATHEEAARVALEAVLVSPSFLYLVEQPRPTGGLNDFEFASRLSYFLWSSMPDETLMELAEKGRLRDPNVLRPQVARMLEDPKAEALTQEFAGQWLSLRRIGDLVPDTTIFPGFDDSLRDSMRGEGEAFFREVLINNLPVRTFLSSDFTFANQRLARHYGFPPMQGAALQKVSIPKDNPRGGLVTQAGILAVYSQQTRSSPIKRGVFILEKLFNRPPPNPPADVPPLEEEVSKVELGAESLREMMERHASDPSCAGCHAKIDPWGLALEEFNGIGAFRTVGKETITSRLHDGRVISGVAGLREELLRRETDFVRGLTEKLMVYGLGRTLKKSDRDDIEAIMTKAKTADYKMKALLISVIESASFQQY